MKRERLLAARARRNWTLEQAAQSIGCAPNTLDRWELGTMAPSAYNRARLCEVYRTSAEELGLNEASCAVDTAPNEALARLQIDLTMRLMTLAVASYDSCWQVQQALTTTIEDYPMTNPNAARERQEALERLAMFPLLFDKAPRPAEDRLQSCAAGLVACGYLATSNSEDMRLALLMVDSYVPMLHAAVAGSSTHRATAAGLLSQALQVKWRLVFHIEGVKQAIYYAEEAVQWARKSGNKVILVMALRDLVGAYEWKSPHERATALSVIEEAQHLSELKRNGQRVPLMAQSWMYTGVAKWHALHGRKQEMEAALDKAEETFHASAVASRLPSYISHSHAHLLRYKSIAHAYLGDQDKALSIFGEVIDLDDQAFASKLTMTPRTRLGALSEAMFSSLKAVRKDKELSIALWQQVLQEAADLRSETYFGEADIAYQIMEAIWAGNRDILRLREQLVHW